MVQKTIESLKIIVLVFTYITGKPRKTSIKTILGIRTQDHSNANLVRRLLNSATCQPWSNGLQTILSMGSEHHAIRKLFSDFNIIFDKIYTNASADVDSPKTLQLM